MHNSKSVEGRGGQGTKSTFQLLLTLVDIFHVGCYFPVIIKQHGPVSLCCLQHCRKTRSLSWKMQPVTVFYFLSPVCSTDYNITLAHHNKMLQAHMLLFLLMTSQSSEPDCYHSLVARHNQRKASQSPQDSSQLLQELLTDVIYFCFEPPSSPDPSSRRLSMQCCSDQTAV